MANESGKALMEEGLSSMCNKDTFDRNLKDSTPELRKAMLNAQKDIRNAGKAGYNSNQRYRYATLEDFLNAVKEPLLENDLILFSDLVGSPEITYRKTSSGAQQVVARVKVLTTVVHVTKGHMSVLVTGEGQDAGDKAIYKAITGARKYSIAMLFGIYTTDDPEAVDSYVDQKKQPLPDSSGRTKAPQSGEIRHQPWSDSDQAKLLEHFSRLGRTDELTAQQSMERSIARMESNERLLAAKPFLEKAIEAAKNRIQQLTDSGEITKEDAAALATRLLKTLGLTTADKVNRDKEGNK